MNQIENTNILVVGGAGFVGNNLIRYLCEKNVANITVVDNFLSSEPSALLNKDYITVINGSIADDRILNKITDQYDYVFHLATYHGNQSSIYDPLEDHQNNTLTSLKLFQHLSKFKKLKKVVYSSAGCTVAEKTYDNVEATDENAKVSLYLDSPYQISKIIGEYYANYFFLQYKLPVVKARFQNVYGPWEILGAGKWRGTVATIWRNVTPTFIWKALHNEPIPVENNGIATRDFIFVGDIIRGLVSCAENGEAGEVYNLSSGVETSILDLAKRIINLSGSKSKIEMQPSRVWDRSGKRYGCTNKAEKYLNFRAQTALDNGLSNTIDWMRNYKNLFITSFKNHLCFYPELNKYFN